MVFDHIKANIEFWLLDDEDGPEWLLRIADSQEFKIETQEHADELREARERIKDLIVSGKSGNYTFDDISQALCIGDLLSRFLSRSSSGEYDSSAESQDINCNQTENSNPKQIENLKLGGITKTKNAFGSIENAGRIQEKWQEIAINMRNENPRVTKNRIIMRIKSEFKRSDNGKDFGNTTIKNVIRKVID